LKHINDILIVDDEPSFRLMLEKFFTKMSFNTTTSCDGRDCLYKLKNNHFDVILLDFRLPDVEGLDLVIKIKTLKPEIPIILMTKFTDVRVAVQAIKMGVFDYVSKPLNTDEILSTVNNALKHSSKNDPEVRVDLQEDFLDGISPSSLKVKQYVELVAPTELSVIITGETGTGKEQIARMIHNKSVRKARPFVAIDCGSLADTLFTSEFFGHVKGAFSGASSDKQGLLEFANGGTIFLDEIGNLSYDNQVKLLRTLQEKKIRKVGSNKDLTVDVRIVSATNDDLVEVIKNGKFREDLFHRLNEFKIKVLPLRERKEDITLFANYFLKLSNKELGKNIHAIDDDAFQYLLDYSWPGNLRELRNMIRKSVLMSKSDYLEKDSLPQELLHSTNTHALPQNPHDLKALSELTEKENIRLVLEKVDYNKAKASRILNIDRKTLYNKIKQYNIYIPS